MKKLLSSKLKTPLKLLQRFNQLPLKVSPSSSSKFLPPELSYIKNGLRIVSQSIENCPTATVGVWIETGSRYENINFNGVANFLEHFLFKGTTNISQEDFENEMSLIGASFDAYTKREETAIFVKCFSENVPKIIEMIADIIQNLKISNEDIENNKSKIISEIESITENDLEQVVFDNLHAVAYQGTSLKFSPLGVTSIINRLKADDITKYLQENFKPTRMILACAGGIDHNDLIELGCQHFGNMPNLLDDKPPSVSDYRYTGSEIRIRDDDMELAHIAIAIESPGYRESDNLVLELAKIIIGSWDETQVGGNNNSSNLARYSSTDNLCRSFKSFNISYRETGLWGIYFVCDPLQCELMLYNIQNEWLHLCTMPIETELERAKEIYKTQIYLNLGSTTGICEDIATQVLQNYCKTKSIYEIKSKIDSITLNDLRSVCFKYIYDRCPVVCAIGPVENLPDYIRIRSSMYWLRV